MAASSWLLFVAGITLGLLLGLRGGGGSSSAASARRSSFEGRRPAAIEEPASSIQPQAVGVVQDPRVAQLEAEVARLTAAATAAVEAAARGVKRPPPETVPPEASAASKRATEPTLSAADVGVSPAQLLAAHTHWDWRAIVNDMMQPWPHIEREQLETAVAACYDNGTMYCQRMQVHKGRLYLADYRAIFFDRHYAPSRVLPLLTSTGHAW